MAVDLISVVEVIHDLGTTSESWLQRASEAAEPAFNLGGGVFVWNTEVRDGVPSLAARTAAGTPGDLYERAERCLAEFDARLQLIPALDVRGAYGERMRRLVGDVIFDEVIALCGLDRYGMHDVFGALVMDPDGTGAGVAVPLLHGASFDRRRTHQLRCVFAHLLSAFRLRRALERRREAVLSPSGDVLHAEGDAARPQARATLRDVVRDIDRARGPLRRLDPDEALDRWRALAAGRWTLVDSMDHDGKRFVVAWRNEPGTPSAGALTAREQQVAALAAQGLALKEMAYLLGLGSSTVATHLAHVMRKLGVRTRAELVMLMRAAPR